MSRKKVKKEVVKRKTNIYDPMGIYGRGLTENQRLGMTRQMKVENVRESEPVITKELLEKYQKILTHYCIQTVVPFAHVINVALSYTFTVQNTLDAGGIMTDLYNLGIHPRYFVCDTFVISKPEDVIWNTSLWYEVHVGSSKMYVPSEIITVQYQENNSSITVPRYFKIGTATNYYQLRFDNSRTGMYINQDVYNWLPEEDHSDFDLLPNDGSPVPYLLYPNTSYPDLKLVVGMTTPNERYTITLNVLVMY